MGRRKERRLAAKIGAGRRVKLDLFAEPSGDLGGSAKDEVGKDMDAKLDAELSNSPSSSGQKEDNPLSLLGQYSDDELDQESTETESVQKDSLVGDDNQTKLSVSKPSEEGEIVDDEDQSRQNSDSCNLETESALVIASEKVEAGGVISNTIDADEKHPEPKEVNVDHVPEASDTQTAEGPSSFWKMVLHEESNQYYYWNTVTGETSWGVPNALSQGTGTASEPETLGTEMKDVGSGDINASSSAFGVKSDEVSTMHSLAYTIEVSNMAGVCEHVSQPSQYVEQIKGDVAQLLGSSGEVGAIPCEAATLVNYAQFDQVNAGDFSASNVGYELQGGYSMISEQSAVDPLQLINHAEAVLERLKSLQWCGFDSDEHGWISKYISEVEIRLSDIRSLLPHGLSLAPFWLHSERQLNQIENGINTEIERQKNKISELHLSSAEENKEKVEERVGESKVNADMKKLSPKSSPIVHHLDASAVEKAYDEASNVETLSVKQTSVDGHLTHLHVVEEGGKEINGTGSPKPGFQSDEDVDMDIDMEVEDQIPTRNNSVDTGAQADTPLEQLAQPNDSKEGESLGSGSEFIPPPPDEEWIPPPPPDNEGIPPPPPDEPPESLSQPPPPAEPMPVQPLYSEQFNLTYGESNANYYANTTTGTSGSSFYEHADGSQTALLHPPVYYSAVPNPANSAMHYGFQNGGMPVVHLDPSIGSSSFQATSGLVHFDPLSSNQIATVDASTGASLLSSQFIDPLVPGVKSDGASTGTSTSVVSAPTTVSVKEYVSVLSYSASATSATSVSVASTSAVADASAAVPKAQTKAVRTKKPKVTVASSLRSNKKVSSLVDKWKAAKEELEEAEEEVRVSPLEILEKKRQREIEEWRAQQIASGEAKENANFQPLGGDWRERVKRRRAKKEAVVGASSDAINNASKQPDLEELSKDLPTGWQAYWDDSSKQVYYGNSITSETSWTKPTR